MLNHLSPSVSALFVANTLLALLFLYRAIKNSTLEKTQKSASKTLFFCIIWLILQGVLAFSGLYKPNIEVFPPKIFLFGILPNLLFILFLFNTSQGKKVIDNLPLKYLMLIHIVRIPVEIGLWVLAAYKTVPQIMTFEGQNFDILAGITAPLLAYLAFWKHLISKKMLLLWNFVALGLLVNIVITAFLSAPSAMQQLAFKQPNIAILYFPFCWLPTFIVPVVLFAHLVSIRQLWFELKKA